MLWKKKAKLQVAAGNKLFYSEILRQGRRNSVSLSSQGLGKPKNMEKIRGPVRIITFVASRRQNRGRQESGVGERGRWGSVVWWAGGGGGGMINN